MRRSVMLILAVAALAGGPACEERGAISGLASGVATSGRAGGAGGSLAGSWRVVAATTTTAGDVAVVDTRWTFTAGGACERIVIVTQVSAGTADTESTSCTFTFDGSVVRIVFAGSAATAAFPVSFSGGDLILGGVRFTRMA